MKIKFGALVVDGRGKIGGQVASKNKAGAYMKNKVTPTNPNTSAQSEQRTLLAYFSSNWRNLTDAQRANWQAFANESGKTNVFGDIVKLSGAQAFNKVNLNLSKIGAAPIDDAPSLVDMPSILASDMNVDPTNTEFVLSQAIPAGFKAVVRFTPSVSAGRSAIQNQLRDVAIIELADGAAPNLHVMYNARFGQATPGGRVGMSIQVVSTTTGQTSVPQFLSCIAF